jgi:photosystem II stability/assembly factor-like uncharacterized protein
MAAGAQDGVYLTSDGGDSWARISAPWPAGPRPVVALTFDPLDSRTLYAGTPHLAWKTNNGGATWRQIPKGMQADSDVFSIEVDGRKPKRLFAGACSGIYRSLDGGGTWASLEWALGGPFRTYVITRKPGRTNVVFAGTSSGLMTSPDGGFTWRKLSAWTARSIAFDPYDPQCMFVATDRGILRSQDGGASFKETNQGLYNRSVTSEIGMRESVPPGAAGTAVVRVKR